MEFSQNSVLNIRLRMSFREEYGFIPETEALMNDTGNDIGVELGDDIKIFS